MTCSRNAVRAADLLKLMRSGWVTNKEIVEEVDIDKSTATAWTNELHAQGLLLVRTRPKTAGRGYAPREYSLAPEWGGQGHVGPLFETQTNGLASAQTNADATKETP